MKSKLQKQVEAFERYVDTLVRMPTPKKFERALEVHRAIPPTHKKQYEPEIQYLYALLKKGSISLQHLRPYQKAREAMSKPNLKNAVVALQYLRNDLDKFDANDYPELVNFLRSDYLRFYGSDLEKVERWNSEWEQEHEY